MPSASYVYTLVDVVADAVQVIVVARPRRRRPKHQAYSHRSHSRSPGCPHIRIRGRPQGVADAARIVAPTQSSCHHRGHRRIGSPRSHPTHAQGVKLVAIAVAVHVRYVCASTFVDRPDRCRCRTHRIHQCSRPRRHRCHRHRHLPRSHHQMPRAFAVAVAVAASAGMSAHPHS